MIGKGVVVSLLLARREMVCLHSDCHRRTQAERLVLATSISGGFLCGLGARLARR